MSSRALRDLLAGLDEVSSLRSHYPVPKGKIGSGPAASAAKAHGRACVVLLSSHFERYLYAVNEEVICWLNETACEGSRIPLEIRLMHTRERVDILAQTEWKKRANQLEKFFLIEAPLWSAGGIAGTLEHARILTWMKSPMTDSVIRFYNQYGIDNIFDTITRTKSTKAKLVLGTKELVEKRNNIAHGDLGTEALPADIIRYHYSVNKFATSADRAFRSRLKKIVGTGQSPW